MFADAEAEATTIRASIGLDDHDVVSAFDLARELQIGVAYYPSHVLRGRDSLLFHPRGRNGPPEIALRRGLTPLRRAWWIAHEISERHLLACGFQGHDVERVADRIAAALLMPRRAFRSAAAEHGDALRDLAEDFACEQTAAVLRLAEVGAVDVAAVVAPTKVYVRSNESFALPDEASLRRLARTGMAGFRKLAIDDCSRRFALIA